MKVDGYPELNARESEILNYIIRNFIISASPVGSKNLVESQGLDLSPASVRNAMNSLENKGLLNHPHTSSGRVPTDLGYRFYVEALMQQEKINQQDQAILDSWEGKLLSDFDGGFKQTAKVLARITNLLAVVIAPKFAQSVLLKIEIITLSSHRILIVLNIEGTIAKTFHVELESEISTVDIEKISPILNERLSGKVLSKISAEISEMLSDIQHDDKTGLIRVFIDSADAIFEEHEMKRFQFGGVEYMPMQPEFSDLRNYKSIVELVEDESLIIHLFEHQKADRNMVNITIGKENHILQAEQCSIVSAEFSLGTSKGKIGLVGPTRMDYPRLAALVEQMAVRINKNDNFRSLR